MCSHMGFEKVVLYMKNVCVCLELAIAEGLDSVHLGRTKTQS